MKKLKIFISFVFIFIYLFFSINFVNATCVQTVNCDISDVPAVASPLINCGTDFLMRDSYSMYEGCMSLEYIEWPLECGAKISGATCKLNTTLSSHCSLTPLIETCCNACRHFSIGIQCGTYEGTPLYNFSNYATEGICTGGSGGGTENCTDGIDNNSNGLTDCKDPGCPPCCELRNLNCPATCVENTYFNVSYEFKNNAQSLTPYVDHNASRIISTTPFSIPYCRYSWDEVYDTLWHPHTKSFFCDPTITDIQVGCSTAPYTSPFCPPFENSGELFCHITPTLPPVVGYLKIQGPGTMGIIRLRLISFTDALSALKGIIKVSKTTGDTNTAADLVETTNLNASPVRVMTPYGIKAWRKEP